MSRLVRHTGRKISRDALVAPGLLLHFAGKLACFLLCLLLLFIVCYCCCCTVLMFIFFFLTFCSFLLRLRRHRHSLSASALLLCLTRPSHTHTDDTERTFFFSLPSRKKKRSVWSVAVALGDGVGSLRTPDRYLHAAGHPHGPVCRR